MAEYFIGAPNFSSYLEKLIGSTAAFAPHEQAGGRYLQKVNKENIEKISLFGYRTVDSLKSFIFQIIEQVSSYFGKEDILEGKEFILLGARGCDLEAISILDRVFQEGDFVDPYYAAIRKNCILISADCTDCGETCFCTMVKGQPYPTKYFDLNLTPLPHGFIVETGSAKGEQLIEKEKKLFTKVPPALLKEKNDNRDKMVNQLKQNNAKYELKVDLSETHKRNLENHVWEKLTKNCVECGACNFICPSCSCFLLLDSENRPQTTDQRLQTFGRYKVWDACLKASYTKVAGGANPRGKLYERLQNRYQCKFDYSFDRLGRFTCVGCGRCIDGCAGKIDMREIFKELERQVPLTAKLK